MAHAGREARSARLPAIFFRQHARAEGRHRHAPEPDRESGNDGLRLPHVPRRPSRRRRRVLASAVPRYGPGGLHVQRPILSGHGELYISGRLHRAAGTVAANHFALSRSRLRRAALRLPPVLRENPRRGDGRRGSFVLAAGVEWRRADRDRRYAPVSRALFQMGFRAEAMTPVYGLAEAGLAVSFSHPREKPLVTEFDRDRLSTSGEAVPGSGRALPSVGKALPGLEIEIRDEQDRPVPSNTVGRIVVRGESITPGFFNDPELTAATIRDGWLDTGDLGFLHEGNLYIAGRARDLIIIRGRNYAPQEIEDALFDVPGVRTGCAVAVSQNVGEEGEQLIVLAEKDLRQPVPEDRLAAAIADRIVSQLSLKPYLVQILEPGTLPRTSSGKFRRADALRMFVAGELVPPEKINALKLFLELGKSQLAWGRF